MARRVDLGKIIPEKGVDYYTEAEKNQIEDEITDRLVGLYKRYESTYTTISADEDIIPIEIEQYDENCILEVYIEGRILNQDEYEINANNTITLTNALSEIGTVVQFVVYKFAQVDSQHYDILKGDKGDSGAIVFDKIADMKADTDLQAGDTCQTLGYYSVNDGGAGLYKVISSASEDDGGSIHVLDNGLRAELIVEDGIVNVKQFGAKGNGIADDTTPIQNAINKADNYIIDFGSENNIYHITDTLTINKANFIKGNKATISGSLNPLIYINITNQQIERKGYLSGLVLDNNYYEGNAITVNNVSNYTIDNCYIKNSIYGITLNHGYELNVNNCLFRNISDGTAETINKIKNSIGLIINTGDSSFNDIVLVNYHTGLDINESSNMYSNIHGWIAINEVIEGSIFFDCVDGGIIGDKLFNDSYHYGYKVSNSQQIHLVNCKNYWNSTYVNSETISTLPYIFYFDSDISTRGTTVYNMTSGTFKLNNQNALFSNIDVANWKNYKNIIDSCSYPFSQNIDNVPNGKGTIDLTLSSNWTSTTAKLILSESGTKGRLIVEATYSGDITTNTDVRLFTNNNSNIKIDTSSVFTIFQKNNKYHANTTPCYLYIGSNGEVNVKFQNNEQKFITIDVTYDRNK